MPFETLEEIFAALTSRCIITQIQLALWSLMLHTYIHGQIASHLYLHFNLLAPGRCGSNLSGNKPLPEPMLTQIYRHMVSLGHNELTTLTHEKVNELLSLYWLFWCSTLFNVNSQSYPSAGEDHLETQKGWEALWYLVKVNIFHSNQLVSQSFFLPITDQCQFSHKSIDITVSLSSY